ncbi:DUF421 domain-containing protein [Paenibacillus alkalitolerans]|uniref:DUF421 domain-containing protein n=1 Tax=Paenibacillus alkalitolerans TaxID=2799335 RepID=UPI0018F60654|nr:DUF421 domain-containing protein [Paenibacillus alkalitolerans]
MISLYEIYFHLAVKLAVGFISLFVITKLIGRRQIKKLTTFDFISAIVLSELVGNTLYEKEANSLRMIYTIAVWAAFIVVVDKVTIRWYKARKALDGLGQIIIKQSKIDMQVLKKNNLDLNELLSLLRQKDVFSLKEVEYAMLEPNGSISVLKKAQYSNVTLRDAEITPKKAPPPIVFILDGKIMENSLKEYNKNTAWLFNELNKQGYKTPEEVLYAEWTEGDTVFVVEQPGSNANNG